MNLLRKIADEKKIIVKFRKGHRIKMIPQEPNKQQQYVIYDSHKCKLAISKAISFLQKSKYCVEQPWIMSSADSDVTRVIWELPEGKRESDMITDFEYKFGQHELQIKRSDYNQYKPSLKEEALYEITQVYQYRIKQMLESQPSDIVKTVKYYVNNLVPKAVAPVQEIDVSDQMWKYPMAQIYDPTISPLLGHVTEINKFKIIYLNVDGRGKKIINNNHSCLRRLLRRKKPAIMAFADVRCQQVAPKVTGHDILHYLKPQQNIGGIVIYVKKKLETKVALCKVNPNSDLVWIEYKKTRVTFAYCRPCQTNIPTKRINRFFNHLEDDIREARIDNKNVQIIGDLNARMGILTGDKIVSITPNARRLQRILNKYKMKIANEIFEHGNPTFSQPSGAGSSSIDLVVGYDPKGRMADLEIDQHLMFKSHRPILLTMKTEAAELKAIRPIYSLSYDKDLSLELHQQFVQETNKKTTVLKKMQTALENKGWTTSRQCTINNIINITMVYILQYQLIKAHGIHRINSCDNWFTSGGQLLNIQARMELLKKKEKEQRNYWTKNMKQK